MFNSSFKNIKKTHKVNQKKHRKGNNKDRKKQINVVENNKKSRTNK